MKEPYQIQMDYDETINFADDLVDYADSLKLRKGELQDSQTNLNGHWTGENAVNFISKCENHVLNLESIESSLRTTAETIRTMAQNIYDAEMEAYEIAVNREA